jgi:hypothetical protein
LPRLLATPPLLIVESFFRLSCEPSSLGLCAASRLFNAPLDHIAPKIKGHFAEIFYHFATLSALSAVRANDVKKRAYTEESQHRPRFND